MRNIQTKKFQQINTETLFAASEGVTAEGTEERYIYKDADKSLARLGRKQATATEDFEFSISYL
jgi:hypothetical protein